MNSENDNLSKKRQDQKPSVWRFALSRIRRRARLVFDLKLVSEVTDREIAVLTERFNFDRRGLHLLLERVMNRSLMVEVGSLAGFSTRVFATYFDEVVSVDPYQTGYDASDINSNASRLSIAESLFQIRFLDDPRVRQIKEPSERAALKFEAGSLDFVYIDAGHDVASVRRDIEAWRPKVRPGAFMGGDDYDWPGLRQVVAETFPTHDVIDNRWLVQID